MMTLRVKPQFSLIWLNATVSIITCIKNLFSFQKMGRHAPLRASGSKKWGGTCLCLNGIAVYGQPNRTRRPTDLLPLIGGHGLQPHAPLCRRHADLRLLFSPPSALLWTYRIVYLCVYWFMRLRRGCGYNWTPCTKTDWNADTRL